MEGVTRLAHHGATDRAGRWMVAVRFAGTVTMRVDDPSGRRDHVRWMGPRYGATLSEASIKTSGCGCRRPLHSGR
jgi:hypothetical protein